MQELQQQLTEGVAGAGTFAVGTKPRLLSPRHGRASRQRAAVGCGGCGGAGESWMGLVLRLCAAEHRAAAGTWGLVPCTEAGSACGGCGKGQRGAGAPQRFWAWLNTAGAQQFRVVLGDLRGLFRPKQFYDFAAAWLPHIAEAGAGCGARCSFLPQMGIRDPSSEACLCRGQRAWV